MDVGSGEIMRFDEAQRRMKNDPRMAAFLAQIDVADLTPTQLCNMQVSRHDTQSKAGRYRHELINKIGRNKPCPCGSGRKFKKCCLNKR